MKMKDKTLRRNLDMKTDNTNRRWKIAHDTVMKDMMMMMMMMIELEDI